jgi:hypothetical protein
VALSGGHICLASLPLNTAEHLAVLAREASDLGFEVCWLSFDSEEMSDSSVEVDAAKALVMRTSGVQIPEAALVL